MIRSLTTIPGPRFVQLTRQDRTTCQWFNYGKNKWTNIRPMLGRDESFLETSYCLDTARLHQAITQDSPVHPWNNWWIGLRWTLLSPAWCRAFLVLWWVDLLVQLETRRVQANEACWTRRTSVGYIQSSCVLSSRSVSGKFDTWRRWSIIRYRLAVVWFLPGIFRIRWNGEISRAAKVVEVAHTIYCWSVFLNALRELA